MGKEIKFVDGLFTKRPANAPDFLRVKLSFNEKFIEWLKNNLNSNGWCNIDVLDSKNGNIYAKKDEWEPNEQKEVNEVNSTDTRFQFNRETVEDVSIDDIPF